jgi:hypothetical protein
LEFALSNFCCSAATVDFLPAAVLSILLAVFVEGVVVLTPPLLKLDDFVAGGLVLFELTAGFWSVLGFVGLGLRFRTLEFVTDGVFFARVMEGGVGVFLSEGRRVASSFTGLFDDGVLYSLSVLLPFLGTESLIDFFIFASGLVTLPDALFADLKLLKLLLLVVDGILFSDCDGGMRATGAIGLMYPLDVVLAFDSFWYSSSTGVLTFA